MTWLIDVVVGVECRFGYIWIFEFDLFDLVLVLFFFCLVWFDHSHEATLVAVELKVV